MTPLRPALRFWPRAVCCAKALTLIAALAVTAARVTEAAPPRAAQPKRGKPAPAQPARAVPKAPAGQAAAPGALPEYADAFPSEFRVPPADLLLNRERERTAEAFANFAQALVAEDNADAEKALSGYRRTLELDPGYADLAVKVAFEMARRNDVSGAIQVLKDTVKAAPKEPLPLVYLSQLYSKHLKKPDLAMKYAEQALALAPDNLLCYSAIYELHVAGSQPKKAEQLLERAAKVESKDAKYWIQLGELYRRLYLKEDGSCGPDELKRMNAIHEKAGELGKDSASVLAQVGDYFVVSRQVAEAIPRYAAAQALKQDTSEPPLANLRYKLARAYLANQQRNEAIQVLEELIKEEPLRFETHELLGEVYEQNGEPDKALKHYEHSLQLDRSRWQNHLRLAEMLLRMKRFEQAAATLQSARTRFRDVPEIAVGLALALSQAKRHTEAMTVFAEAHAEAENSHEELLNSWFFVKYGAAAEQAGLLDKAAELLKRAISLDPANAAEAYNYLGYMWVDRGENLDEAGEMIKKAVELEPDNGAFIDSLGWYHYKKGEPEKALKELLRAAENIKPEDAVVYDHIGDAYLALGRTAEALSSWQKALSLEQDNKKIAEKIESVKQKVTSAPTLPPAVQ